MANPKSSLAPTRDIAGGIALVLGAVAAIFFMSHHPHGLHGEDALAIFEQAAEHAGLIRFVHVALIGTLFVLTFGHISLAYALGLQRPLARLGLVTYAGGAAALVLAGVLNGLVFPAMAEHYVERNAADAEVAHIVTHFSFELNQALAALGTVAIAIAIGAWSLVLGRVRGAWRWIGIFGITIAAGCAAMVLSGRIQMDVHGFGSLIFAQSAWALAAGARLTVRPKAPTG